MTTDKKSGDTSTTSGRRRLLKVFAGGGVVATIPVHWVRPVVDSVMLPAHAQTSGCLFYGITGFRDDEFSPNERATICVQVCGDQVSATFQTDFDGVSYTRRTGTFTNGQGTMVATVIGPNCSPPPPNRTATLTNITPSTLTYTMQRGANAPAGPLVATLDAMSSCPTFIPVTGDCTVP
jgi:hypothetical protein